MHLKVLNEQKQNALDTYSLFVDATTSDAARDLVTGELVKSVFTPGETGYLDKSGDKTIIDSQSRSSPFWAAAALRARHPEAGQGL
jgi:hypothetical protein